MKRIISVILVLAMILILPPFSTEAADQGPYYAIEGEKTVKSGETVSLKVAIYNNPGIISLRFRVTYDENLELVEIVDGKLLSGMSEPSPNVASPYILKWADYRATANNTANGVVVTLVFRAKANLVSATAAVGIEHVEGRNANGSKVAFASTTTTIEITSNMVYVRGDLDLDGDVDAEDLTILARHVAGIEEVVGDALTNADVDGDSEIDSEDLTLHARYVAGIITDWDQEQ